LIFVDTIFFLLFFVNREYRELGKFSIVIIGDFYCTPFCSKKCNIFCAFSLRAMW
jgi:hypothetical protein